VCGEATTGRDAVELSRRLRPDIVVMDLSLPELNGLDATRQILKDAPDTEVFGCCPFSPFVFTTC
jgi:DNA-binding NarL/FixJ family response regulator